ncbi:hypothetical protein CSE16_06075 [Solibacillus sp. R5-41]|uniref:hypothetical protein n=1 Tax=Solibacillus sp. R5-41 TaxID=2048654 RepID=UPI000C1280E0|nr:hypothetical protein [Solibacillus sp. R5-41]ATP39652.1 hypothetical protein CSE16_06075 [Solibacillus sp. R5-41]
MITNQDQVEVKIEELQNQTTAYVSEIRQLIAGLSIAPNADVISYFTASLNISHDTEQESLCLGNYHIRNIGNEPLTNVYFCIKLPENSPFTFSGQYVYEHFSQNLKLSASWERINDRANKEEFWLRPLNIASIEPNETITFPNFQLKWEPSGSYAGTIMGVTYCDQLKEGIAAINPINLSGSGFIQEDEHE